MNTLLYLLLFAALSSFLYWYLSRKNAVYEQERNLATFVLNIITKDGQSFSGSGALPQGKTETIKITIGAEEREIQSSDISSLLVYVENNKGHAYTYEFIYTPTKRYNDLTIGSLETTYEEARWMLAVHREGDITQYVGTDYYGINKKGEINAWSDFREPPEYKIRKVPLYFYYLKRTGEDVPTKVGVEVRSELGATKYFRSWGAKYFRDCPQLAERIRNKMVTSKNGLSTAIEFYIKECKQE